MQAPSGNRPSVLDVITSRRRFLITTAGRGGGGQSGTLAAESERKFQNPNQMKGNWNDENIRIDGGAHASTD